MTFGAIVTLALAGLSRAQTSQHSFNETSQTWGLKQFSSWVAFGDSYTDDSRLSYFVVNNGSAPPVGWVNPAVRIRQFDSQSCAENEAELCIGQWWTSVAAICQAIYRTQVPLQLRCCRSSMQQQPDKENNFCCQRWFDIVSSPPLLSYKGNWQRSDI